MIIYQWSESELSGQSSLAGANQLPSGFQSESLFWYAVACLHYCSRHKSSSDNTYYVIKILSAHATLDIDAKYSPEQVLLNELIASVDPSHPAQKHWLSAITRFRIESVAGNHICLVLPLMDGSIIDLEPPARTRFAIPVAKLQILGCKTYSWIHTPWILNQSVHI